MKRILGTVFLVGGLFGWLTLALVDGPLFATVGCFLFTWIGYRMLASAHHERQTQKKGATE